MSQATHNNGLLNSVDECIRQHSLLHEGDRVIVALSGGADSVALLAVLHELGFNCLAAHCNFHLRGDESDRDMLHSRDVCQRLGVELIVKDFDVESRRLSHKESVEMACRSLRYEWFDALLAETDSAAVAVGHHREDNIETILLNLLRGTGIDGLCGIRYRRGNIIRPLLDCSRKDIEDYLSRRGLDFITDSSNFSDAHLRNRLRNHIIPCITEYFPDAEKTITTTIDNINSAAGIYHKAIYAYRNRFVDSDRSIDLKGLVEAAGDDSAAILREIVAAWGLTPSQCRDIISSAAGSGLRFPAADGRIVELDRGRLTLAAPTDCTHASFAIDLRSKHISEPIDLDIEIFPVSDFTPCRDPRVICLDADILDSDHRIALRHRQTGDRIKPFGIKGSRLVSDIFNDAKYSAAEKRNAWLLTCDDTVLWVVGLRTSRNFTISDKTKQYIKITYNPQ